MLRFMQLLLRIKVLTLLLVLIPMLCLAQTIKAEAMQGNPPFTGTIFLDPDIITPSDPSTFQSMSYTGQDTRVMYDRRLNAFITVNAYLFKANFDDGLTTEIQVNPEFGSSDAALVEAQKYAPVIGRLPTVLRTDVQTVWIHKGTEAFGGGNNNLLIHTGQADLYAADGILEETLVHEASHTSLDPYHAAAAGWLAAQTADSNFISTYARDNPTREDVAESFLPYLAVHFRADRISQELYNTIVQTIPNRIDYLNNQAFNMYPIETTSTAIGPVNDNLSKGFVLKQNYPNPFNPTTNIRFALPQTANVSLNIYNSSGQFVRALLSTNMTAGSHNVQWDATNEAGAKVAGGIYFYRIIAGKHVQLRKMVLIK